ncbi:MAG: ribonuclease H-like domain-containing protein [Elusimicrobia bacterium]|nr:ribonuclease H-like domain-containing protein [Elusimicrobiota bacterium]
MSPRAYLDIETDWRMRITVVGVFRPDLGSRQWISPDLSAEQLRQYLQGIRMLFTYNGARFDLPIIKEQMKLDLVHEFRHRDLMHDCWAHSLYGGLKKVEQTLGIHRDTEGVNGLEAIRLWDRFVRAGEKEALDVLLRYNREDVENLESLAIRLGIVSRKEAKT